LRTSIVLVFLFLLCSTISFASDKDSLDVYLKKGGAAFANNDYPKSLEFFHKALEFDSLNVNALHNLGVLYSMKQDHHMSLGYLRMAVAQDSTDPDIFNSLGITYSNLSDTSKASASPIPI